MVILGGRIQPREVWEKKRQAEYFSVSQSSAVSRANRTIEALPPLRRTLCNPSITNELSRLPSDGFGVQSFDERGLAKALGDLGEDKLRRTAMEAMGTILTP